MSIAFSKINPSFFTIKEGSTSHLGLLPSGKKRKPLLPVALNRFALRLTDHQRSRQYFVRDGTALTIGLFHYQIRCFSTIFLTSEIL